MMEIRTLEKDEYRAALELAWNVFLEFEAPEYTAQGVEAFHASIRDADYIRQLRIYGAYDKGALVGILATRNGGTHIALFFVLADYQRQGIGRDLFSNACHENPTAQMTVNASPYAVEVYRCLGFVETAAEQSRDGIRYTPMLCAMKRADCPCKRKHCERHSDCVACKAHHRHVKNTPVYCERPTKDEKRALRRQEHNTAQK